MILPPLARLFSNNMRAATPWASPPGGKIAPLFKEFPRLAPFGLDPYLEKTYDLYELKFVEII
jgi:hypothetical protein